MLVFGTQIHIITFIFIVLELGMFIFQLFYYLFRPQDNNRLLYLILLFLLLFYNITGGLFPDPKIHIPVSIQEMIAYGSGFLMASYFPYYFYRAFDLKSLRWHSIYGVPLFLMSPYVIFFIIIYSIDGDLNLVLKYGMIIPLIYAIILLYVIFQAIRKSNLTNRNNHRYWEEVAMYCAITPWAALAVFGIVESSQVIEVLCTNTGIICISILFIYRSIKEARLEYQRLLASTEIDSKSSVFEQMCTFYKLTNREVEIILLMREGLTHRQISEKLFIASKTVENHIRNVYEKTGVNNKTSLIHKLFDPSK